MAQVARDPQLPQQPYNTLPPLSTMTQGIHQDVQKQHASNYEVRDSGNWSMPSKRKLYTIGDPCVSRSNKAHHRSDSSTVSNNTGISHLLNPDDSPRNRLSEASGLSSVSYASSNNSNSQQVRSCRDFRNGQILTLCRSHYLISTKPTVAESPMQFPVPS